MRLNVVEAGEGTPVALLHGLFGAAQNWGTVQKALVAACHRVLALDLRNHGASPHAAAMDYPAMAADVAETLEAAGARPAALVGHSMGGKVAPPPPGGSGDACPSSSGRAAGSSAPSPPSRDMALSTAASTPPPAGAVSGVAASDMW